MTKRAAYVGFWPGVDVTHGDCLRRCECSLRTSEADMLSVNLTT